MFTKCAFNSPIFSQAIKLVLTAINHSIIRINHILYSYFHAAILSFYF